MVENLTASDETKSGDTTKASVSQLNSIARKWIALGAVLGLLGVALGAFGAHGLQSYLEKVAETDPELAVKRLGNWRTAAMYQMHHAIAIVLTGVLMMVSPSRFLHVAAKAFLVGVVVFSGMLYTLVLLEWKLAGAFVLIGGVGMILGWLFLVLSVLFPQPTESDLIDA